MFENRKTYRFNRYYLITALILPFIIPLLSLPEWTLPAMSIQSATFVPVLQEAFVDIPVTNTLLHENVTANYSWGFMLPLVYFLITCILSIRLILSLKVFIKSILNAEYRNRGRARLIYTNGKFTPYTILRYIFIPRNQPFSDDIISHEMSHVKQWHTLDIFLVEFLQVFCWFNPALPFYRKAIMLNHEYLADESVVNSGVDRNEYLRTLLAVCDNNNPILSHKFNKCSTIKKRVKMMMKKNSKTGQLFSILTVVPMFAISLFLFAGNNYAQTVSQTIVSQQQSGSVTAPQGSKLTELLKDSIFAARFREYNQIIAKSETTDKQGRKMLILSSISKGDENRMKELFLSMTPEQQSVLRLIFKRKEALAKKTPSKEDYDEWKDPAVYGIWLDGERVENSALSRYQHSDFSFYNVSKLYPNAKNYGKHVYQLDIYTNTYYDKQRTVAEADETLYLRPNFQALANLNR